MDNMQFRVYIYIVPHFQLRKMVKSLMDSIYIRLLMVKSLMDLVHMMLLIGRDQKHKDASPKGLPHSSQCHQCTYCICRSDQEQEEWSKEDRSTDAKII